MPEPFQPERPATERSTWLRVALLIAIVAAVWIGGWASGLHENFSIEQLRRTIQSTGPVGILAFLGLFCIGQVAQISGHPFIAAAVLAFGWWQGAILSVLGGTLGAILSFALARKVGGDVRDVQRPLLQRILATLDRAPKRTITLARVIFMTAPPLATAFALSGVRHRDHAVATLLGLVPSVFPIAYGWGYGLKWFVGT